MVVGYITHAPAGGGRAPWAKSLPWQPSPGKAGSDDRPMMHRKGLTHRPEICYCLGYGIWCGRTAGHGTRALRAWGS